MIKFQKMYDQIEIPRIESEGAAGMDIRAVFNHEIQPGKFKAIPTGLKVEIEQGYQLEVRPRSGLAKRHGVTVLNSPGTIDSDYRGEIQVLLINHGTEVFLIDSGDRIAQLVLSEALRTETEEVLELSETARGAGGFGSTGR